MRKIAQRSDIRDLILDGVDVLLSRYGYRKMTMEDLARQVGIGKGTIYLHFPSKKDVTLSHIDRIVDRVLVQLRAIAHGPEPIEVRLREMLMTRVLFRLDSVQHYSESMNDLLSDLRTELLARREGHFEREAALFAEILRQGKKSGMFYFGEAIETSRVLITATNALLPYSLSVQELGSHRKIADRTHRVADLLVAGLMSRRLNIVRGTKK